jgi:two-component system KDP operon response regulator KdpE
MSNTILFVNDDAGSTTQAMRATLTVFGHFSVLQANTVEQALALLQHESPDLVVLDINMPGMRCLEACRAMREISDLHIIVTSVSNAERDKVLTLDAGADDYVTKPYSIQELLARIRAALRRRQKAELELEPFVSGDLEVDFASRRASLAGRRVHLTPKEHDLLRILIGHADRPVPHRKLLQIVWGRDYGDELDYLHTFIYQLRRKIEPEPCRPRYLLNEPNVGYYFAASARDCGSPFRNRMHPVRSGRETEASRRFPQTLAS